MAEKATNIKKGDDAYAEAKKAMKGSFFNRSDPEKAAGFYREAAKQYKIANEEKKLLPVLLESAKCHKELRSLHQAATDMKMAAEIAAKDEKEGGAQAAKYYQEAASYYRANNNPDVACDMFVKAATCLVDKNADAAMQMCDEAIKVVEEESRGVTCDDKIQKCVGIALKANKLQTAIDFMKRQNKLYGDRDDASLFKNNLQMLVVYFAMEDYKTANIEYRTWEADDKFCNSEYWEPSANLIGAWESGSLEALQKAVKASAFKYLNNQIARIAAKLTFSQKTLDERAEAAKGEVKDDASDAAAGLQ